MTCGFCHPLLQPRRIAARNDYNHFACDRHVAALWAATARQRMKEMGR